MYHYWSFHGIDALVSAGLGGGSLIYANVFIRKDEKWFVQEDLRDGGYEHWPVSRDDLDPHYDRVESMIGLQRYPFDHEPYSKTPKTIAFKAAAEANGMEWFLPKLAVTFANEGRPPVPGEAIVEELENLHGRTRTTCQLCGECDVGCNYGAKNTLDYNYLTHAAHHGAELRTLCDVRRFEPRDGGGYAVTYAALEDVTPAEDDGRPPPLRTVTCDHLVLSAGTLGTTNLLLRNRAAFPRLSRRLGTRFCGNGDLLTLAINTREMVDGKPTPRIVDPGYGPVITSTARMPDALDGGEGRGFYLQDAGYPQQLAWILHVLAAPEVAVGLALDRHVPGQELAAGLARHRRERLHRRPAGSRASCRPAGCRCWGWAATSPTGGCSCATAGSTSTGTASARPSTSRACAPPRAASPTRSAASFADNPIWFLRRVITVHPLGGCPMGRDATEGVVDPYGNVFGYPGLHIADGSIMPGPVGPNPSFTIAALADRFADSMLEPDHRAAEAAAA